MNRRILQLAVPNIITNITVPLLGMVDLIIVGHIGGQNYIGAIAIGTTIFNFIYWNFGFLRMGTSGFTAQAYGSRDFGEAVKILIRGITIALGIAFLLIILQIPIGKFSLFVVDGSEHIESLAYAYFRIRIWAAPATLGLYAIKGWFIGMQNAKTPMFIAIAINLFNIGFSLFFALGLNMDIEGVALGTVFAQYGGLILSVVFWIIYYRRFLPYVKLKESLKLTEMKRFFSVNTDIFIRSLCLVSVFTCIPVAGAKMGDTILAVNTLLMQFFTVFSYIMDGFAYAGEALTGRYIGAKSKHSLRSSVRLIFRWGLGLSFLFVVVYAFWGEKLLWVFTNDVATIQHAHLFYWWVLLVPLSGYAAFLWDGIFVGATASKTMRNAMLISTAIFFTVYYAFSSCLGNHALWLALIVFLLARGIIQWCYARKSIYGQIE
ncbi:MAG: MATE family efflux transporter [Bacteroidales bacterium]|jgi:MATE family multidrug resistance protein|nr:MATE family efflux transporter [Bacteroidales bacterium]